MTTHFDSIAEHISKSFQAWEIRGRGWQLADYPCDLEPPYRPFFLLPGHVANGTVIDDGKRHTLVSGTGALIKSVAKSLFSPSPAPIPAFEEPAPFKYTPYSHRTVTYSVRVPTEYKNDSGRMERLLLALGSGLSPVAFELVGHDGRVHIQITSNENDAEHVRALIESYIPENTITESSDLLTEHWKTCTHRMVVDFGLSEEFFLPLNSESDVDTYLPLIPSLASIERSDCLAIQVLFERTKNPWERSVREAVGESESDCIYGDATHFVKLSKQKTESPLFAVCLRVAIASETNARLRLMARSINPFMRDFDRPGANNLIPLENDDYSDQAHEEALLDRTSYRTGMLLSATELQALAHFPDKSISSEALVRDRKRTRRYAGATERIRVTSGSTLLGLNRFGNEQSYVPITVEERLSHLHIVGASGTGKSTLIKNLVAGDIAAGHGVAVLDPAGDLVEDVARAIPEHRFGDVILFDPSDTEYPIGLNLLEARTELEKITLADDIVSIFERLSSNWGDTMTTVLSNAVLAAIEHREGGTLLDIRRLLIDDDFRKSFIARIEDEEIRYFWQRQYPIIGARSVGPLLSRLDAFLRPKAIRNLFAIKRGPFNLASAIAENKIVLAKLSHGLIGEHNSYLLGSLLISKIQQAAMARQSLSKEARQPYFLYIDECQNFTTPSLNAILSGTRKYALGLTLAHQHLAQLDPVPAFQKTLLGNAHSRIVYRVGSEDAKELAHGFEHFEASDLISLSRGEAIARIGSAGNDFSLRTLPAQREPNHDSDTTLERVIKRSRESYATKLDEIPKGVVPTTMQPETQQVAAATAPRTPTAPELPETTPTPVTTSHATDPVSSAKPPLRDVGRTVTFEEPDQDFGKGGREHRYIQQLIKRLGEDRGYKSAIEYPVEDGRVDIVLSKGTKKFAFEISVTNTANYELGNLEKCLKQSFNKVFFVSPDSRRRDKVQKLLTEKNATHSVIFVAPENVVGEIEALNESQSSRESVVRGYKVKVNRQVVSSTELAGKRAVIAEVIAKSMMR